MAEYEGEVVVYRTPRMRHGRGWSLPDRRKPPWTTVLVLTDKVTRADHRWQLRFGDRQAAHKALLDHEGCRVRVRCAVRPWSNGLGAYASRASFECLTVENHVLRVLAGGAA